MAMYIRVKRSKTTYFVQCDPTESVLDIKQKLQTLTDQPVNDQRLILVATGEALDDSKTLADQKVENDAVVALTLRKDDNAFEHVNIVQPDDFYNSRETDGGVQCMRFRLLKPEATNAIYQRYQCIQVLEDSGFPKGQRFGNVFVSLSHVLDMLTARGLTIWKPF